METKKGKVIAVYGNGTWESPNGLLYRFEIEMENGDRGQYLSKTQDCAKFPQNGEVWYTTECQVRNGKEYYRIKPAQDPNSPAPAKGGYGGGGYQKDPETEKRITRMSVLKVACDLVVNGQSKVQDLTKIASILEQYVMTGEDTISKLFQKTQKPASGIVQNFQEEAIKDMVDDLPF